MTARVRLFAALRELAGSSEVEVEAADVSGMLAELSDRFGPEFARVAAAGSVVVAGENARGERRLVPGEEVAILPPVSGG